MDAITKQFTELKKDGAALRREVREKTLGYIIAALGLVAGLAWNEAIKALIDRFFPLSAGGIMVKFLYAVIVTLLVALVGYYLVKISKKDDAGAVKQ